MTVNIGVKTTRTTLHAVVLKDGVFSCKFFVEADREQAKRDEMRWDRNYQLNALIDGFTAFTDHVLPEPRITVESAEYLSGKRAAIEGAQTVGAILSLPYTVFEASSESWKNAIVGRGGVTEDNVREIIGRFQLGTEFGDDINWFDTFCIARFGYLKDEQVLRP